MFSYRLAKRHAYVRMGNAQENNYEKLIHIAIKTSPSLPNDDGKSFFVLNIIAEKE